MTTTDKKANIETYFIYADAKRTWYSKDRYDDYNVAVDAAIASLKSTIEKGYKPVSLVIIKVERHVIYDEFMIISEQTTKTTVEMISKDYVSSLRYLDKEDK